jgi:hypothetical protein
MADDCILHLMDYGDPLLVGLGLTIVENRFTVVLTECEVIG